MGYDVDMSTNMCPIPLSCFSSFILKFASAQLFLEYDCPRREEEGSEIRSKVEWCLLGKGGTVKDLQQVCPTTICPACPQAFSSCILLPSVANLIRNNMKLHSGAVPAFINTLLHQFRLPVLWASAACGCIMLSVDQWSAELFHGSHKV